MYVEIRFTARRNKSYWCHINAASWGRALVKRIFKLMAVP